MTPKANLLAEKYTFSYYQRWYQGIEHSSAFSSSGPSPSVVNGHALMAAVPTPVPMIHTSPM